MKLIKYPIVHKIGTYVYIYMYKKNMNILSIFDEKSMQFDHGTFNFIQVRWFYIPFPMKIPKRLFD